MMKKVFFYLLSVISIFSSSVIAKADFFDVVDMRFVPANSSSKEAIVEPIKKLAEGYKSRFAPLLNYLAEANKPNINDLTISDKIAMTVDEFEHKVRFTTFLVDKGNKVVGRAEITYAWNDKKETTNNLYNYVLSGNLLQYLTFCEIQHSLNQSEKSSIEELVGSGQTINILIPMKTEDFCKFLGLPITKDNSLNSKEGQVNCSAPIKCNVLTAADYKTENIECEEE